MEQAPSSAGKGLEAHLGLEFSVIGGHFLFDRLDGALLQAFTVDVAPSPDTRQVGNLGVILE
jgi:hypothetical protein